MNHHRRILHLMNAPFLLKKKLLFSLYIAIQSTRTNIYNNNIIILSWQSNEMSNFASNWTRRGSFFGLSLWVALQLVFHCLDFGRRIRIKKMSNNAALYSNDKKTRVDHKDKYRYEQGEIHTFAIKIIRVAHQSFRPSGHSWFLARWLS